MAGDIIDTPDRAVISQKLKYNSVIKNLKMNLCEYESQQMNTVILEIQNQNIMEKVESNKRKINVFEAKEVINNIKKAFQSKVNEFLKLLK